MKLFYSSLFLFISASYRYRVAHVGGPFPKLDMLGRWLGFIEFSINKLMIISKKIVITGPGGGPRTVGHDH